MLKWLYLEQAEEADIIITTALIPGKPAPKLILEEHVKALKDGSVVVDLAAEQGGNCELTEAGKVVNKHGVTIITLICQVECLLKLVNYMRLIYVTY